MPSQRYKELLDRAWDLHVRKNAGYAGADNPDPWANFRECERIGVPAFTGVMVRLTDKYIRVLNLIQNPDNDQVGESILETLDDLAAYANIARVMKEEEMAAPTVRDVCVCHTPGILTGPIHVEAVRAMEQYPDHAGMSADEAPAPMDNLVPKCDLLIAPNIRCERKRGHRGECYHS